LAAPLNKVTSLSKGLAAIVFIALPFVGFWLGMNYRSGEFVSGVEITGITDPTSGVAVIKKDTIDKVSFDIELANPTISDEDDPQRYQQAISADVTFSDGKVKQHSLGTAYGCVATTTVPASANDKTIFGKLECYYALSDVQFIAYLQNDKFIIERNEVSAKDGSVVTTVLLKT